MINHAPLVFTPMELDLGELIEPAGRMRLSYVYDYADEWDVEKLTADFGLGEDFSRFVRVEVAGPLIFRALDETWLSVASDLGRATGDLSTFARVVAGDVFSLDHALFFELHEGSRHYQFVTGSACLDVIAASRPQLRILAHTSAS